MNHADCCLLPLISAILFTPAFITHILQSILSFSYSISCCVLNQLVSFTTTKRTERNVKTMAAILPRVNKIKKSLRWVFRIKNLDAPYTTIIFFALRLLSKC